MKKIVLIIIVTTISVYTGFCQSGTSRKTATNKNPQTSKPVDSTEYFDESNKKISNKEFADSLSNGQYALKTSGKSMSLIKSGIKYAVGAQAPDFVVQDIKGQTYSLKNLKGKTIVLNFWFVTCPNCIKELPELNKLVEKYKNDENVVFLAITFDSKQKVQDFIAKKRLNYKIIPDQKAVIKNYGISSFPVSLVIDEKGIVNYTTSPYLNVDFEKLNLAIKSSKS